ncbi:queuine tRNA-ribosyltransferase family protein [Patescibacteria group bacterium]|nr:queuine tRNA-ribosyltransferase family protein [Patescibacteria group bacterium]
MNKMFKYSNGRLECPLFFPDATKAVVRSVDSQDVINTRTPGILVNTLHLYLDLGERVLKKFDGIGRLMGWPGALISDSGGFQVMSLAKKGSGKVTDAGVSFHLNKNKKVLLTPEKSIEFQSWLKTDLMVVLDDFTMPKASYEEARETVGRTIAWARRSKAEFERIYKNQSKRPYLIAVVQGGAWPDLRKECCLQLAEIGFDGYGYGGWPMDSEGKFDYNSAKIIADNVPKNCFLYGLGIGKPDEVVNLAKMGYDIFDCVLPTRDARHGRLYVSADNEKGYSFYTPKKEKYYNDDQPVDKNCDCLLCTNYSRAYLRHLFKIEDLTAVRLATIHNLRFYSILMEKLRQ